jgi:[CysO sulfur-carrier protein]-thiocarboxylate-dependent cysteine synthase
MAVYRSVLDMVGNTPLLDLTELSPKPEVRILAKLEGQNPTGSVKDRIALAMVEAAEADGSLRPGQTILEPSSGNTGIGLAMVCRVKGYKLKIVLPENVSIERRQLLEIMGAEVIPSPGEEGSNGAVRMAQRLAKEMDDVAFLYQYGNPNNPQAHYEGTGPEIWRDCPEVTHFVSGLGTSGTLMGVGRYLKARSPGVQIWAVEPPAGEQVQGLRSLDEGFVPPVFDPEVLDRKIIVRPRESVEWVRRLNEEAAIIAGISSGAAMAGAAKAADQLDEGVIVTLFADGGWKYLSTGVWTDPIDEVVERLKTTVYF